MSVLQVDARYSITSKASMTANAPVANDGCCTLIGIIELMLKMKDNHIQLADITRSITDNQRGRLHTHRQTEAD